MIWQYTVCGCNMSLFFYSISRFHILSPLDFTISAISYPVLYEYETTISKTEILAEEIGIHVVCFSAESNYRRSTGSRCITVNVTDNNKCAENPCQNNGTCVDLINDYKCSCGAGFNGTNCEESTDIDECAENPCQKNGTCLDFINGYRCNCVAGFNDTNCTNYIDEWAENPCQNNATCVDLINDYNCSCVAGFNGTNCEENIDECADSPCQSNGTCADLINGYDCSCAPGFNGTNCEEEIDECAENPCQNNGTCLDLINDYQCNCVAGFNDTNCTNNVDECASLPCQNNGTCVDLNNEFECQCDVEFNGTDCSTKSNLMKYQLVLNLAVTTTENLSIEEDYIKVKNKVQEALTDVYSKRIVGSKVIIKSLRKGSLIVDFDLVIPDSPSSKVLVVDTVYKLVNGLVFVNFSGEIVNVTTASIQHSTYGEVIITNSSDGCAVVNSQGACDAGYSCQEFINHTVACIPIINCS